MLQDIGNLMPGNGEDASNSENSNTLANIFGYRDTEGMVPMDVIEYLLNGYNQRCVAAV